jgi:hypothetical protein
MESIALVVECSGVACTDGVAGDFGETGYAQIDGRVAAGGDVIHLGALVAGAGQADFHALGFAEPMVGLGFGDTGLKAGEDLGEAATLVGVGSQQGKRRQLCSSTQAVIGTAEVAEGDSAAFEVAEKLGSLLVTGGAVVLAGAQFAGAGDERLVTFDDLDQ